ncbi:Hypothetical predicted protein [Marmota monax]|uniref:Uncharacterized protein n=1 Tax=Marmota monax TaxID=9995 RepID=A0A5E4CHU5_MARMO|nr:hypothetical protein GHT09_005945 [Marmota monax]VTJ81395.1 Hypothetical predicted protein [Marmota monax]
MGSWRDPRSHSALWPRGQSAPCQGGLSSPHCLTHGLCPSALCPPREGAPACPGNGQQPSHRGRSPPTRFVPPKTPTSFGASGQPSFAQLPPTPQLNEARMPGACWGRPTGHWARAMEEAGDKSNPKPSQDWPRTQPPEPCPHGAA